MKQLYRAVGLEIMYLRYMDYLRKLNRNVVEVNGVEIDCSTIKITREDFAICIAMPRGL